MATNEASSSSKSVVCAEVFDAQLEPTQEEINEFAVKLGIDISSEPQLLSIAREGLLEQLPAEWKPIWSESHEDYYYFNFTTGRSQWGHPLDPHFRHQVEQTRKHLSPANNDESGYLSVAAVIDEDNTSSDLLTSLLEKSQIMDLKPLGKLKPLPRLGKELSSPNGGGGPLKKLTPLQMVPGSGASSSALDKPVLGKPSALKSALGLKPGGQLGPLRQAMSSQLTENSPVKKNLNSSKKGAVTSEAMNGLQVPKKGERPSSAPVHTSKRPSSLALGGKGDSLLKGKPTAAVKMSATLRSVNSPEEGQNGHKPPVTATVASVKVKGILKSQTLSSLNEATTVAASVAIVDHSHAAAVEKDKRRIHFDLKKELKASLVLVNDEQSDMSSSGADYHSRDRVNAAMSIPEAAHVATTDDKSPAVVDADIDIDPRDADDEIDDIIGSLSDEESQRDFLASVVQPNGTLRHQYSRRDFVISWTVPPSATAAAKPARHSLFDVDDLVSQLKVQTRPKKVKPVVKDPGFSKKPIAIQPGQDKQTSREVTAQAPQPRTRLSKILSSVSSEKSEETKTRTRPRIQQQKTIIMQQPPPRVAITPADEEEEEQSSGSTSASNDVLQTVKFNADLIDKMQASHDSLSQKKSSCHESSIKGELSRVGQPLAQSAMDVLHQTFDQELDAAKKCLEMNRNDELAHIKWEIEPELESFRQKLLAMLASEKRKIKAQLRQEHKEAMQALRDEYSESTWLEKEHLKKQYNQDVHQLRDHMEDDLERHKQKLLNEFMTEMGKEEQKLKDERERKMGLHEQDAEASLQQEIKRYKEQLKTELESHKARIESELQEQFQKDIHSLREQLLAAKIKEEKQIRIFNQVPLRAPPQHNNHHEYSRRLKQDLQSQMEQIRNKLRVDFMKELHDLETDVRQIWSQFTSPNLTPPRTEYRDENQQFPSVIESEMDIEDVEEINNQLMQKKRVGNRVPSSLQKSRSNLNLDSEADSVYEASHIDLNHSLHNLEQRVVSLERSLVPFSVQYQMPSVQAYPPQLPGTAQGYSALASQALLRSSTSCLDQIGSPSPRLTPSTQGWTVEEQLFKSKLWLKQRNQSMISKP